MIARTVLSAEEIGRAVRRIAHEIVERNHGLGDVVLVGSSMSDDPPVSRQARGDVRAYGVRSGDLLWTFHVVAQEGEYGVDQMRYMSDLEHVRERTGMYIGNRDVRGLHHLVTEVVDNSIDEVMAGHASVIKVTVNVDGSIVIEIEGSPVSPESVRMACSRSSRPRPGSSPAMAACSRPRRP